MDLKPSIPKDRKELKMIKKIIKRKLNNFLNSYTFPILTDLNRALGSINSKITSFMAESIKKQTEAEVKLGIALHQISQLKQEIQNIKEDIDTTQGTVSLISRSRKNSTHKKLRIIFLIHHIAVIDSLITIIHEAQKRGHDTIVITIKNNFATNGEINKTEEFNHLGLEALGMKHLRFGSIDSYEGLEVIKHLNPDYIFRQSPWDNDIEKGYSAKNLSFCKVCYTPYFGIQITEDFNVSNTQQDLHVDQEFHRYAFAIFIENSLNSLNRFKENSILSSLNVVQSGLPKYEYIASQLKTYSYPQSLKDGSDSYLKKNKTVLWTPHHSFDDNWLGFATFLSTYKVILETIHKLGLNLIFRPHPLFEKNLLNTKRLSIEEYTEFKKNIDKTPGFTFSHIADPVEDFMKSDLLLIDGISMLATYQLMDKPIVWINSQKHAPFTPMGKKMIESVVTINESDIFSLEKVLTEILIEGKDELTIQRQQFASLLLGKQSPSQNILNFLEDN